MLHGHTVIDTHCHIYPAKIAAKAVAATGAFYRCGAPLLDGSAEAFHAACSAAGVDRALVCSVATTPHQVSSINRYIAGEVSRNSAWLSGLGALHPLSDNIARDVDEVIGLGLLGVKLHPDMQGHPIDSPEMMSLLEAAEGRLPVLIHSGDYRFNYSNADRVIRVCERFPKLQLIAAHFGSYTVWEQAEQLYGLPNLWVDCSSSLQFVSPERAREMIEGFGEDRVLFGSDSPMYTPAIALDQLVKLDLCDGIMAKILGTNAISLFGS